MKAILTILAALSVAAPVGAFVVPPDAVPSGPSSNKTDLKLRYCYEIDEFTNVKLNSTWNKECVKVGRQTRMFWTTPKKCDDFEGCVKVGMLMGNDFHDDAYFEDEFFMKNVAIFKAKKQAITYFDEFTINCQGKSHDVILQGVNWTINFNTVNYRYDTGELRREICNKAFNVDTKAIRNHWRVIPVASACNLSYKDQPKKIDQCVETYIRAQEIKQWK